MTYPYTAIAQLSKQFVASDPSASGYYEDKVEIIPIPSAATCCRLRQVDAIIYERELLHRFGKAPISKALF